MGGEEDKLVFLIDLLGIHSLEVDFDLFDAVGF
jgi:hypothetical protein